LEANPESVTADKAAGWRRAGVNRLSLGLQTFDDGLLREIGRLHTSEQFRQAYQTARQSGFQNISFDLIYGIVGQSMKNWRKSLQSAVALAPEHLSLYSLTIEEHTSFFDKGLRIDEDRQAQMYEWSRSYLRQEGYEQYEISNFARPGRVCEHNMIYWRQQDYLGLGVGAVGCVGGVRWQNQKTLNGYETDVTAQRLPWLSQEILDAKTRKFERLMLGLRLREGCNWEREDNPGWFSHRRRLAEKGWLEEIRPGCWRIPDAYIRITNQVLLPFA
jgi:oxygen-independent coproporphyrinogen-3 oxidase